MAGYAQIVNAKTGLMNNIWGFIDGTLRHTCRPTYNQKLMYSGHKRHHGIRFQSAVTHDGLFACMFGAINGNRHDSYMMTQSGLLQKLRDLIPAGDEQDGGEDHICALYADPAYPLSAHILGGYRHLGIQPLDSVNPCGTHSCQAFANLLNGDLLLSTCTGRF